ncbi:VanZ family protein [Austwickia sp. TVS 96-490-7B]|uniref:VanZ family protein n=1 Tax=Austwickia sp. TVS 96-490-7B TaxID=2830843 RepID=UPI001C5908F0|nr:VanZ family protein [Austwickia sp. TVS 96-490-7B]
MSHALWSGQAAVEIGVVVFFLAFLPIVVWQHRRYGDWNRRRLLGAALVSVYAASLATYTLLPLPDVTEAWCDAHGKTPQWELFHFVTDISTRTAGLSWRKAMVHPVVLQVVFNVIFFVPWGIFARRWAHLSILGCTASGLGATVLIETTQATGLWGMYPCAYRLGDVDDLFLNTSGAVIGAVLAPAFLWWMPDARELVHTRQQPRPVTVRRRWTGMAVDATLALVTASVVVISGDFLGEMIWGQDADAFSWGPFLGAAVAWLLVWLIPAVVGDGASIGQTMVWLAPRWPVADRPMPRRGSVVLRVLRASVIPGVWTASFLLPELEPVWLIVALIAVVSVPFTHHRSLSGLVTGAVFVDVRGESRHAKGRHAPVS